MQNKIIFIGLDIGNLQDLSLRVVDILKTKKVFIVEHRKSFVNKLNLLNISDKKEIYELPTKSKEQIEKIILNHIYNEDIVYCSEEGMPATTDPGTRLVRIALDRGIQYSVYPGPSISSIMPIASGFCCGNFIYRALIPKKDSERYLFLENLYNLKLPFISVYPSKESKEIKNFCNKFIDEIISIFSENAVITLAFNLTHVNELILSNTAKDIKSIINKVDFTDLYLVSVLVAPVESLDDCL